jgi:hypothetical protein
MPSLRETILAALHVRLSALAAIVLRGDVLPKHMPAAGLLILRDGGPGGAGGDAIAFELSLPAPGRD